MNTNTNTSTTEVFMKASVFAFTPSQGDAITGVTLTEALAFGLREAGAISRDGETGMVVLMPEYRAACSKWWHGHDADGFGGAVPPWAKIATYLAEQRMAPL